VNVPEQYRTFWPRFWAGWVDALVFLPLWPLDSWLGTVTKNPLLLAVWFVVYTFVFDAYSVAMHARYGQTLGKMLTGVKVLDLSGGKLSLRQALIRDSVPILLGALAIVDGLPLVLAGLDPYRGGEWTWLVELQLYGSFIWFAAEVMTMLLNSKRRAVHDLLARSVVVRVSVYKAASDNAAA
jgi:uncharacterized RDD family membrane protein YckC